MFAERLKAVEALVQLADQMAERFLSGDVVSNLGLKVLVHGNTKRAARRRKRAGASAAGSVGG